MINNIFEKFGFIPKKEFNEIKKLYNFYYEENKKNKKEKEELALKLKLKDSVVLSLPFIKINEESSNILSKEKRENYVAKIAGFYEDILKDKILKMISNTRGQLSRMDSTLDENGNMLTQYKPQDFDLILKGTENAFWLIYEWGKNKVSEHIENQKELTDKDLVELKNKVIKT